MKRHLKQYAASLLVVIMLFSNIVEEIVRAAEEPETAAEEYLLNYLVIENGYIEIPGKQNIVVSIGETECEIQTAVLGIQNISSDEELQIQAAEINGNGIRFQMDFADESQTGSYEVIFVTYVVNEMEYTIFMADAGIDAVFGVEREVEVSADAYIQTENQATEVELNIVSFDENGNLESEQTIADAFADAKAETQDETGADYYSLRSKDNYVVVLDPGHDSTHSGTQASGYAEEELVLKIAQFCKEELQQYSGVTVYMTRETEACPNGGASVSSGTCNNQRVEYAASKGADFYVSFHLNYSDRSNANGAGVYYPNSNYRPDLGQKGEKLAVEILTQLNNLGLNSWAGGILIRNTENGTIYPDGSLADYLGVIRKSKEAGIAAVLIEHAFQSNPDDVNNYLNSDEKLKRLGIADATGIAEYLGVSKESPISTSASIAIENQNNVIGSFDVAVSNVQAAAGVKQILVPVWSQPDQADIRWYAAAKQSDGIYRVHVDVANHNCNYGTYQAHVYITNGLGAESYVGESAVKLTKTQAGMSIVGNSDQSIYTATAWCIPGTLGQSLKGVQFAIWSEAGGQDDLIWYTAKASNDKYVAEIPISSHRTTGKYYVHIYAAYSNGKKEYVTQGSFYVSDITTEAEIAIENQNNVIGSFDVAVSNIQAAAEVKQILVPVWSQPNQADIRWYAATKQSDGIYRVHVDVANHNCNYGTYQAHVYITNGLGAESYVGESAVKLTKTQAGMNIVGNSDQSIYTATAWCIPGTLGQSLKGVQFAVWSEAGGQDDLIWYTAKASNDKYVAEIPISSHRTTGKYYVHIYAAYLNGKNEYIAQGTFDVPVTTTAKVTIENQNNVIGSFDVVVSNIQAAAGVKQVLVSVWSQPDQADIRWYAAAKQGDGTYRTHVDVANHNCNYGTYRAHAYITNGLGVESYVGESAVKLTKTRAGMSIIENSDLSIYTATAWCIPGTLGQSLKGVQFAVWSEAGGQDDLIWYTARAVSDKYVAEIPISSHRTAGKYYVHIYAAYSNGKKEFVKEEIFQVPDMSLADVTIQNKNEADGTFEVRMEGVSPAAGILQIKAAVWCAENQSDIIWYNATKLSNDEYAVYVDVKNHDSNMGNYKIHIYGYSKYGIEKYLGNSFCLMNDVTNHNLAIMGSTAVTLQQLVSYYNANAVYPIFYADTEAFTIEQFCRIYMEECEREGVKTEVAFCQAMLETGFLHYGGDVGIGQYNFGGMGATGNGAAGLCFSDVRTGIRAQVQHLKAYASTDALLGSCVDPRFYYVKRGSAPYVEWLGISENPYYVGWASAPNYGYIIRNNYIKKLLEYHSLM